MWPDNAYFPEHKNDKGVAGNKNVDFSKIVTFVDRGCDEPVSLELVRSCYFAAETVE